MPALTAPAETGREDIDLRPGRHLHLVGVGGCGMSGLARMLVARECHCTGSDQFPSDVTASLVTEGMDLNLGPPCQELPDGTELIIASAAIPEDHPEVSAARTQGLPVLTYAEALGQLQRHHLSIAISGTHGKSTTASMLCHILIECGLDPGFIIGAQCDQIGGGSRTGAAAVPQGPHEGEPGILVCEACEFNRSFHHHRPDLALINNIEEDHLDIYGSLEAIIEAFREFASLLPPAEDGGSLLIAHDGARRQSITPSLSCRVSTFGFHPEADYQVVYDANVLRVGILREGMWVTQWTNRMPGGHNALNAAAAVILAHQLGAEWEEAAEAMGQFTGLDRRMQRLGERPTIDGGSAVVYDDYGHHPTEIEQTLKALHLAEKPDRLICVFQPHQHSRTRFLLDHFAESFASADEVIVPRIYFVRDSLAEKQRVSAVDLVEKLDERGVMAKHIPEFDEITDYLRTECRDGDLVVIMGAGPVWTIGRDFMADTP
ncbi:MAG: UDP-N-acetylmuramate--L-alanine ligase [Planctomycetota bacterium]|nr:UDP-N-acetylmuramate--L-alanine ligase [Planctomycetota bacterium]